MSLDRRAFLQDTAAAAAALALPRHACAAQSDLAPVFAQIDKRHDEAVVRMQQWIRQPSIAAENRGGSEGCELTMRLLREAGFEHVPEIPTGGQTCLLPTFAAAAPPT